MNYYDRCKCIGDRDHMVAASNALNVLRSTDLYVDTIDKAGPFADSQHWESANGHVCHSRSTRRDTRSSSCTQKGVVSYVMYEFIL